MSNNAQKSIENAITSTDTNELSTPPSKPLPVLPIHGCENPPPHWRRLPSPLKDIRNYPLPLFPEEVVDNPLPPSALSYPRISAILGPTSLSRAPITPEILNLIVQNLSSPIPSKPSSSTTHTGKTKTKKSPSVINYSAATSQSVSAKKTKKTGWNRSQNNTEVSVNGITTPKTLRARRSSPRSVGIKTPIYSQKLTKNVPRKPQSIKTPAKEKKRFVECKNKKHTSKNNLVRRTSLRLIEKGTPLPAKPVPAKKALSKNRENPLKRPAASNRVTPGAITIDSEISLKASTISVSVFVKLCGYLLILRLRTPA